MPRIHLLLALLLTLPCAAHAQSLRDTINQTPPPTITPWKKPQYPESRDSFLEGFKQAGYQLVCGVKEARDCMGFTNQCPQEISVYTDACAREQGAAIPATFASIEGQREVNRALFKCVADKQRESGAGVMSIDACNKLNELQQRSAAAQQAPPPATKP